MTLTNEGPTASSVFAGWTLHGDGRLTGEGVDIQLPPKEWHVLRLLLASEGALITKDRLLEWVWPRGEVAEEIVCLSGSGRVERLQKSRSPAASMRCANT